MQEGSAQPPSLHDKKVPPLVFPHPDEILDDRSPGIVAGCD
jgi:hypothetical protein